MFPTQMSLSSFFFSFLYTFLSFLLNLEKVAKPPLICSQFMKWIFSFYFSFFLNAYNTLYASFFKSRERERGHLIAILRKGGWRKRFKGLLSFFDGFLRRAFSFTGERCSVEFGGKASVNLLSEKSFRSSPEFRQQFQYILSRQLLF